MKLCRTVVVLKLMPVEGWSSSSFTHHDLQRSMTCSVTLHGLYVAAVPKFFHLPVIPLIVDCGVSNRMKFNELT